MKCSKACSMCIEILNKNGFEAFLVGGAPRNFLLNLPITDYDLTTNAQPLQTMDCFKQYKTFDMGLKHGTVAVYLHGELIEITTYRTESNYINHRYPKDVFFTNSLKEDCARRDFTINAICYHPTFGFIDFYDGQTDIKNKIVRCIGNAEERFNEDALRILRAIRFSATLNFKIEPLTHQALFTYKDTLKSISSERICDELFKILLSNQCANRCFEYQDIIEVFIPELHNLTYSPYKRNLTFESLSISPPYLDVRFALLISRCLDDPQVQGRTIMNRLKFSNNLKNQVLQNFKSHEFSFNNKKEIKTFLMKYPHNFQQVLDYKSAFDSSFDFDSTTLHYQEIIKNNECYTLSQLAINGKDLLQLNITGPSISRMLQLCLIHVIDETIPNNKDNLLHFVKSVTRNSTNP